MASRNDLWGSHDEIFNELPGIGWYDDDEAERVLDLYVDGFTHHSWEPGYDADAVHAAREAFWEFTGIDPADFDWEEWKAVMGYE